jgi:undecaprenyl-phosphate 4-deoxy-4-formamido-L-arabinose transferase
MRNYGQHNALLCGIREARYDILITLDDDLQNPPEEIPKLIEKLHEGYDVVYGVAMKQQHGFWRNAASVLTKLALQSAVGAETARKVSSYRVFHTQVRDVFADYQSPHVLIDVLLTWGTTRFAAVSVQQEARQCGSSNYNFLKLMTHAINMVTGFTTLPLRAASVLGFGFTLFGVGILVFVVGRYLIQGSSVPGFPFLASIIAIFSGVQLFALGIIGEYLARVYFRTMDRPAYMARCKTFAD